MNSEKSLNPKSIGISKWIIVAWIIVALVGFVDSIYLTSAHYQGGHVTCALTKKCDLVLASEYATFAGIPVALGGVIYYLFMFLGGIFYWDRRSKKTLKFLAKFSVIGLLASVYLFYLQAYVINAFCQYCLLSALTSTLLLILGIIILSKLKNINKESSDEQPQ